jgi:hypothetical protein
MSASIETCPACGEPLVLRGDGRCANCGIVTGSTAQPGESSADSAVIRQAGARRRNRMLTPITAIGVIVVLIVATAALATGVLINGSPAAAPRASSVALATGSYAPSGAVETAGQSAAPSASGSLATSPASVSTITPSGAAPATSASASASDNTGDGCGGPIADLHPTPPTHPAAAEVLPALPSIAAGHFGAAGALIANGGYDTATLLQDGQVLFIGGGHPNTRAELYDPATDKFTQTGSMTEGRSDPIAVLLPNGKVLVASGNTGGCALGQIQSVELYDPGTGHFTSLGTPLAGSGYETATMLANGKVLLAGGQFADAVHPDGTPSAELFDPATNTFSLAGAPIQVQSGGTATLLADHTVLIAGGSSSSSSITKFAELYRPDHNDFVAVSGSMAFSRSGATATLLGNGLVLIAGGIDAAYAPAASAELYDPATGTFAATGTMIHVRTGQTATLLPGNKVLMAGGLDSGAPNTAEIWSGGSFTATAGNMTHNYAGATATLLSNGRVLIVGSGSADLYQP